MGEVVSVFPCLLQFPSYDVINDVIMSDADCTLGREPRSVAASYVTKCLRYCRLLSLCTRALHARITSGNMWWLVVGLVLFTS